MSIGKQMLGRAHVLPSVVSTLVELQIEGTFPSGTYLVTVHHPISTDEGDLEKALYGSFLPIPSKDLFPAPKPEDYEAKKMPGAVVTVKEGKITLNEGRKRISLKVTSKGDRPIQVRTEAMRTRSWALTRRGRLVHITTSLRQTRSWTLIASRLMDTVWILLLGRLFALSLEIARRSI